MTAISFSKLFQDFPLDMPAVIPAAMIEGIAIDNCAVKPGYLFVAMKGGSLDGHDYTPDAIQRGASAVMGDRDLSGLSIPYLRLQDPRRALTWLAAALHGFPARRLTMIGVTGTDGKTTTSNLLHKILVATD